MGGTVSCRWSQRCSAFGARTSNIECAPIASQGPRACYALIAKAPRQNDEREHREVKTRDGLRQPFEVLREPAEARHPCKAPLDHPAPWQQREAPAQLRHLHHAEHDPVVFRVVLRLLARVALVDVRQLDVLPRRLPVSYTHLTLPTKRIV